MDEINPCFINCGNVCGEWMGGGCKARTLFTKAVMRAEAGAARGQNNLGDYYDR